MSKTQDANPREGIEYVFQGVREIVAQYAVQYGLIISVDTTDQFELKTKRRVLEQGVKQRLIFASVKRHKQYIELTVYPCQLEPMLVAGLDKQFLEHQDGVKFRLREYSHAFSMSIDTLLERSTLLFIEKNFILK